MRDREDIEAWADALLDANRSAPPPPERGPEAKARAIEELPPVLRYLIKHGHADPDLDTIERMQRNADRARRFENAQAIISLVGVIAVFAFLFSFYSSF